MNATARSDPEGCTLSGKLDSSYRISLGTAGLSPLFSCEYTWFYQDDYAEAGAGAANLNVSSLTNDSLKTGIGLKLDLPIRFETMAIVPEISGRWMHEFLSRERLYNVTMSGSPGVVYSQALAEAESESFRFGGGVTAIYVSGLSLFIGYQGELERHAESHSVSGELRWVF
jgi:outer membrane autotransporter protein